MSSRDSCHPLKDACSRRPVDPQIRDERSRHLQSPFIFRPFKDFCRPSYLSGGVIFIADLFRGVNDLRLDPGIVIQCRRVDEYQNWFAIGFREKWRSAFGAKRSQYDRSARSDVIVDCRDQAAHPQISFGNAD